MCKQCEEIDAKIAYYRQQLVGVDDQTAIVLLNIVIADLESDKAALHPEDK
jgi:hypothetical protein